MLSSSMENWLAHKAMIMLFHAQLLSLLLWISGKGNSFYSL